MEVYLVAAPGGRVDGTVLPVIRDHDGDFARMYNAIGGSAYVIRPDGYLGYVRHTPTVEDLTKYLGSTFG